MGTWLSFQVMGFSFELDGIAREFLRETTLMALRLDGTIHDMIHAAHFRGLLSFLFHF